MKKSKKQPYTLLLNLNGLLYESAGATPTEALANLPKPSKIMAKGILTISNGDVTREMLLQPVRAKRLFYNSAGVQAIIAKQLFLGLVK